MYGPSVVHGVTGTRSQDDHPMRPVSRLDGDISVLRRLLTLIENFAVGSLDTLSLAGPSFTTTYTLYISKLDSPCLP